ncbi:hypothetical protein B0T25DRAFT_460504 [Lasiosphaeria hispida]|uniref:RRM domain-containing protein n=1 Tax=Lasiosphaeria hispida TaxID=260671 RepID=A0AAJ0MB20_9PEZI|nr:hypothetical protein B0T25DRAFT_460504 [Lasiosphaeria hispida]
MQPAHANYGPEQLATASSEAPQHGGELAPAFSENYQGDRRLKRNMPASVPDNDNCAFFITGLPSNVTTRQLLANISNTGRIWQSHINAPDFRHNHAAAKVAFFTRAAADVFWNATRNGFWVGGYRAIVQFNRHKVGSQLNGIYKTRVLIIKGNPTWVNLENMLHVMGTEMKFWYLDEHSVRPIGIDLVELTLQFGSFRAQAESAFIVLIRRLGDLGVTFSYGMDPCGVI